MTEMTQNVMTGMILPSMQNIAEPHRYAHWVDRMLLMRRVRRQMTNGEYIAYCKSATPIR